MPSGQREAARSRREEEMFGAISGRIYPARLGRYPHVLIKRLYDLGARGWQLQLLSLGSIGLCIGLWIRAKTVDQEARGNAERRALFVGLWAPTFWLMGESLERHD
jgi:hypothetical protein